MDYTGPGRAIWVLKVMGGVIGVPKVLEGDSKDYKGPGRAVWVPKVLEGSYELKGS